MGFGSLSGHYSPFRVAFRSLIVMGGGVMAGRMPCHWYENPDHPGEKVLIPCCPERVQDWDAACTCELLVDELARLRRETVELRAALAIRDRQYADLSSAVLRHAADRPELLALAGLIAPPAQS